MRGLDRPLMLADGNMASIVRLGEAYRAEGYELALVGGPVRDLILGVPPHDFDMASNAKPGKTSVILRAWGDDYWNVGEKYGTIGARRHHVRDADHSVDAGDMDVEVTTYRSDSYERGSRKPSVKWGTRLEDDLARRDLTINAMAITIPDFTLVDPFNGLSDLENGIIRTPRSPEESFGDDPLRMLRAVRFVGKLGFRIDDSALRAISMMAPRLDEISRERVSDELSKIMLSPRPSDALRAMHSAGLMDYVLPELEALAESDKTARGRHKANFEHSLTVLDNAISMEGRLPDGGPDLILRLASLLHDVGKAPTRKFHGRGKSVTFDGHEVVGARMVKRRLSSLKYPGDVTRDVSRLVELHMRAHGYAGNGGTGEVIWSDSAVRRLIRDAGPLYDRLMILTRADVTTYDGRKARKILATIDVLEDHVRRLKEQEDMENIRPELDGGQIMSITGVKPGRVVGVLYDHMLEYRMDNGLVGVDAASAELMRFYDEVRG